MKRILSFAAMCVSALGTVFPVAASTVDLDGVAFTTNDWFDASFTSLAVDTAIATNSTTGITCGAGMWTEAPTNGTAKIVADGEGPATYLEVKAPGESLTFTPSTSTSPSSASYSRGMRETSVLLPQPVEPIIPTVHPAGMCRFMLSSTFSSLFL